MWLTGWSNNMLHAECAFPRTQLLHAGWGRLALQQRYDQSAGSHWLQQREETSTRPILHEDELPNLVLGQVRYESVHGGGVVSMSTPGHEVCSHR